MNDVDANVNHVPILSLMAKEYSGPDIWLELDDPVLTREFGLLYRRAVRLKPAPQAVFDLFQKKATTGFQRANDRGWAAGR